MTSSDTDLKQEEQDDVESAVRPEDLSYVCGSTDFAVICSFFVNFQTLLFGKDFSFPYRVNFPDLAEDICQKHASATYKDLLCKLLRKCGRMKQSNKWLDSIIKVCLDFQLPDSDDIADQEYSDFSIPLKLKLLKCLCELQFDNEKFHSNPDFQEYKNFRLPTIGRDNQGHSYYHLNDGLHILIYKSLVWPEKKLDEWQLVADNRDKLQTLITTLGDTDVVASLADIKQQELAMEVSIEEDVKQEVICKSEPTTNCDSMPIIDIKPTIDAKEKDRENDGSADSSSSSDSSDDQDRKSSEGTGGQDNSDSEAAQQDGENCQHKQEQEEVKFSTSGRAMRSARIKAQEAVKACLTPPVKKPTTPKPKKTHSKRREKVEHRSNRKANGRSKKTKPSKPKTTKRSSRRHGESEEDNSHSEDEEVLQPMIDYLLDRFSSDDVDDEDDVPLNRVGKNLLRQRELRMSRSKTQCDVEDRGASSAHTSDNDDTPCIACSKYNRPSTILLCDTCNDGFHMSCLVPTLKDVPAGQWFCPACEQKELVVALNEILCALDVDIKRAQAKERALARIEADRLRNEHLVLNDTSTRASRRKAKRYTEYDEDEIDEIEEEDENEPREKRNGRKSAKGASYRRMADKKEASDSDVSFNGDDEEYRRRVREKRKRKEEQMMALAQDDEDKCSDGSYDPDEDSDEDGRNSKRKRIVVMSEDEDERVERRKRKSARRRARNEYVEEEPEESESDFDSDMYVKRSCRIARGRKVDYTFSDYKKSIKSAIKSDAVDEDAKEDAVLPKMSQQKRNKASDLLLQSFARQAAAAVGATLDRRGSDAGQDSGTPTLTQQTSDTAKEEHAAPSFADRPPVPGMRAAAPPPRASSRLDRTTSSSSGEDDDDDVKEDDSKDEDFELGSDDVDSEEERAKKKAAQAARRRSRRYDSDEEGEESTASDTDSDYDPSGRKKAAKKKKKSSKKHRRRRTPSPRGEYEPRRAARRAATKLKSYCEYLKGSDSDLLLTDEEVERQKALERRKKQPTVEGGRRLVNARALRNLVRESDGSEEEEDDNNKSKSDEEEESDDSVNMRPSAKSTLIPLPAQRPDALKGKSRIDELDQLAVAKVRAKRKATLVVESDSDENGGEDSAASPPNEQPSDDEKRKSAASPEVPKPESPLPLEQTTARSGATLSPKSTATNPPVKEEKAAIPVQTMSNTATKISTPPIPATVTVCTNASSTDNHREMNHEKEVKSMPSVKRDARPAPIRQPPLQSAPPQTYNQAQPPRLPMMTMAGGAHYPAQQAAMMYAGNGGAMMYGAGMGYMQPPYMPMPTGVGPGTPMPYPMAQNPFAFQQTAGSGQMMPPGAKPGIPVAPPPVMTSFGVTPTAPTAGEGGGGDDFDFSAPEGPRIEKVQ